MKDFIQNTKGEIVAKQTLRWDAIGHDVQQNLALELNRLFLNDLSSVRMFLDHSETLLKRLFGNDSPEFQEFNQAKHSIYDSSFSYRFFYELRNYAQHCGLPLEGFSHTSNFTDPQVSAQTSVIVVFNKRKLLSDFDWKKITKDLKKRLDEIGFEPLFSEMNGHIKLLSKTLKTILRKSILESANYLNDRIKHLLNENVNVCLFSKFKKRAKGKLQFTSDVIPAELVSEILQVTYQQGNRP